MVFFWLGGWFRASGWAWSGCHDSVDGEHQNDEAASVVEHLSPHRACVRSCEYAVY